MAKTIYFESYEDFCNRKDRHINGTNNPDHASDEDLGNVGCWNCDDCNNCCYCNGCTDSVCCNNCDRCNYCNSCNRCTDCNSCNSCTNCDNCFDCTYCDRCDGRVATNMRPNDKTSQ